MLSEEEKVRIRLEEEALLEGKRSTLLEREKLRQAENYQKEVRAKLNAQLNGKTRSRGRLILAVVLVSVALGLGWLLLSKSKMAPLEPDQQAFVDACQQEVFNQRGSSLIFANLDQIRAALNVSPEGFSWQGWADTNPQNSDSLDNPKLRYTFSCSGRLDKSSVRVEFYGDNP